MPKNIVILDEHPTTAQVLHEALVHEGYDIHLVTQPMRFFDVVEEVQPDLLLLDWSTFLPIEAQVREKYETDAFSSMPSILIGVPTTGSDQFEEFDQILQSYEVTKIPLFAAKNSSPTYDFINVVNEFLDRPETSAAIPAGNLTRTYSYPGSGLRTRPYLHWSLPFHEQVSLCRPILAADQRVYLLDSQGNLCALEADTGEVVWSFSPGLQGNENEDEKITAFCLQGRCIEQSRHVYGASTHNMLYEVDQDTGQILRSWQTEGQVLDLVSYGVYGLLLVGCAYTSKFDLLLEENPLYSSIWDGRKWDAIPLGLEYEQYEGRHLTLYHRPDSSVVMMYGWERINTNGEIDFVALGMDQTLEVDESEEVWNDFPYIGCYGDYTPKNEGKIFSINPLNMPVLDGTLYLWGSYLHFTQQEGGQKRREEEEEDDGYDPRDALFALDPWSGAVKWRYHSSCLWWPIQLVAASNHIFLIQPDGVEAVDVQTHQQHWQWEADFGLCQALAADGLLYVLGTGGQIVALDLCTGQTRWTWHVQGEVIHCVSTIENGTLYVATTHALYALRC